MPRLPSFIGPTYADLTREVDAQETFNLFPEKVESGSGAADMILRKIPGRNAYAELTDAPFRGAFAQDGRCFVVYGVSFYEVYDSGSIFNQTAWVKRGTVAVDAHPAAIASNGAGGNQLLVVSGGYRYVYSLTANTLTQISDGIPGPFRKAEFLNGYFFTMSGLFVYASALENGSSWNAAAKFQRSAASDDLQSIILDDHKILWLIGSKTSEPLYDAGLSPFPLTPVQNSFMSHGTPAPNSAVRFDNTVFMLGGSEHGDRYAFIISNGQSAQRVSTHAIENAWRQYSTVSDAYSWTYSDMGHVFVVLTFPAADATWAYDASTGMWHRLGAFVDGAYKAHTSTGHCFAFGKHLVGTETTLLGHQSLDFVLNAVQVNPPATDLIRWMRRSPHLASEGRWLTCDRFELTARTGLGFEIQFGGDGEYGWLTDPMVNLTYSDDGGYTWVSQRPRTFGRQGEFGKRIQWNRLGRFRNRVWEVNGNGAHRVTLIDAHVEVR